MRTEQAPVSASTAIDTHLQQRQFGFRIGRYNFLIEHCLYSEFLSNIQPSPLPNAAEHVEGLINVRGNIVPVYHLDGLLGLERKSVKTALMFGKPEIGAALIVDSKPVAVELVHAKSCEEDLPLPESIASCCSGAISVKGEPWWQVNHDRLFGYLASLQDTTGIPLSKRSLTTMQ